MIALEVSSADGAAPHGGIGGSIRNLVRELLTIDPATTYLLCHRLSRLRRGHLFRPWELNSRLRVVQDPWNRLLLGGARMLHSLATFVPRTPSIPKILTVHDLAAVRHPEWYGEHWHRSRVARFCEAVSRADWIVTPSEFQSLEVQGQYGFPKDRIRVIGHGVDTNVFRPTPEQVFARIRSRYGAYVVAVGLVARRKNFARLVRAMQPLDGLKLLLIGRPADGEEDLQAAIGVSGVEDRIIRLSKLSQQALVDLLGSAVACVVPSLYEGFGLSALEALACGIPVVCSRASSLPEVVGDAALLVDPLDVEALTDGIRKVTTDRELAEGLVSRGLKRAAELSWTAAAVSHRQLYADVCGL